MTSGHSYAAEEGRLVWVANLPDDVRERDIDSIFGKYGRISSVSLKSRPPAFAFVEFNDRRDASDAVRGRDNYDFYGYRLRVEFAKGGRRNDRDRGDRYGRDDRGGDRYDRRDDRRDDRGRRDDRRDDRGRRDDRRERREPRQKREFKARDTAFRVLVKGIPEGSSWQDLKDFVKKVVRPIYTDVEKDADGKPIGVVGFESADDVDRCVSKLDDTKFATKAGDDDCYVRVMEDKEHRSGGGDDKGRSPDRKSRIRSASPRRRDVSRSRSRSPVAGAAGTGRGGDSPSPMDKEDPLPEPASRSPSPEQAQD